MRVAILVGGPSAEREVSLRSGEAVYTALLEKGHVAERFEIDAALGNALLAYQPEVVFIAAHGKPGEDGTVQGLLEVLGLRYTGSRILASSLAMDKIASKLIFAATGIPTPDFIVFEAREIRKLTAEGVAAKIVQELGLPVVIKAPNQGSTIGTYIVKDASQLLPAIQGARRFDPRLLAEKFVPGPEITAAVLGNDEPVVLPLIEIVSHTGHYDYAAKYTTGLSDHLIPPRLDDAVQKEIRGLAVRAYRALGIEGFGRVDFIVAGGAMPKVLEINTVPGMTGTSLFPDAARAAGIAFPDLCQRIIDLALARER